jgi:hypothetical protein
MKGTVVNPSSLAFDFSCSLYSLNIAHLPLD